MPLGTVLKKMSSSEPIWSGPNGEGPSGGITSSLLSRFLSCRERFRVLAIEGLRPTDHFSPPLDFGSMWHICEEVFAKTPAVDSREFSDGTYKSWGQALKAHCQGLLQKYPFDREQITHWYDICAALFPEYTKYWASHPDVNGRTPLLQEQVFDVRYKLPSGRFVRLRGKWDSVDLLPAHVESGRRWPVGVWLKENKTKSTIEPAKIAQQLAFDLQTGLYVVALYDGDWRDGPGRHITDAPVLGICYNVVRRSAHKSVKSMLVKVGSDLQSNRAGEWFSRWKVGISSQDIERFKHQCLAPILESLLDWYDKQMGKCHQQLPIDYHTPTNWRTPYFYNPLAEGGSGEVDRYLNDGSRAGLQRVTTLFPELEN